MTGIKSVCTNGCCKLIKWNVKPSSIKSWSSPIKAGVVLTDNKNRLLIVQSRNFKWGFPKGSIEPNESIPQCASRELQEETTIFIPSSKLETKPVIQIYKLTLFVVKNCTHIKININTLKTSTRNNDVSGIGWVNPDCLKQNTTVNMTKALNDYLTK